MKTAQSYLSIESVMDDTTDTVDGRSISFNTTQLNSTHNVIAYVTPRSGLRTTDIEKYYYWVDDDKTTLDNMCTVNDDGTGHSMPISIDDIIEHYNLTAPINGKTTHELFCYAKSTYGGMTNVGVMTFDVEGEQVSIFNDCELLAANINPISYTSTISYGTNSPETFYIGIKCGDNAIITPNDIDHIEYYVNDQFENRRTIMPINDQNNFIYSDDIINIEYNFDIPEEHNINNNITINCIAYAKNGDTLIGSFTMSYDGALFDTLRGSVRWYDESRTTNLTVIDNNTIKASLNPNEWGVLPLLTNHIYSWCVWFDGRLEDNTNYIEISHKNNTPDIILDLSSLQKQLLNIAPNTTETHTLYVYAVSIDNGRSETTNINVELSGNVVDTIVDKDLKFFMHDADNGDWFVTVFDDDSDVLSSQISRWECYIVGQEDNIYAFSSSSNNTSNVTYWKKLAESTLNFDVPYNTLKEFQVAFRVKSTFGTYSNIGIMTMYIDNRDTVSNTTISLTNNDNIINITNNSTVEYQIDHIEYYIVGQESNTISVPFVQTPYQQNSYVKSTWLYKLNNQYYNWSYYQYGTIEENSNHWLPYRIFSTNIPMADIESNFNLNVADNTTQTFTLKVKLVSIYDTESYEATYEFTKQGNIVDTIVNKNVSVAKSGNNYTATLASGALSSQVDHWTYWIDSGTSKTLSTKSTTASVSAATLGLTAPDNTTVNYVLSFKAHSTFGTTSKTGTMTITVTGAVVDTIDGKTLTVSNNTSTISFALPSSSLQSQVSGWTYYIDEILNHTVNSTATTKTLTLNRSSLIETFGLTAPDNETAEYNLYCRANSTLGGHSKYAVYKITVEGTIVEDPVDPNDDPSTYSSLASASGNYIRVRFSDASINPTTLNVSSGMSDDYSNGTWTKCTDTTANDWFYQKSGDWTELFYRFFNSQTNPSLANCTVKIIKGSYQSFYFNYAYYGCDRLTEVHNYFMAAKSADFTFASSGLIKVANCTFRGEQATADYLSIRAPFQNCSELVSVKDCTYYNLYYIYHFFYGCSKLEELPNICAKFIACNNGNDSAYDYYQGAFYGCSNVRTGMLENYNSIKSRVENQQMFAGCGTNTPEGMEARAQIPIAWGGDLTEEHDTLTFLPTITTRYVVDGTTAELYATLNTTITGQTALEATDIYIKYPGDTTFTHLASPNVQLEGRKFSVGSNTVVVRLTCEHGITTDKTVVVDVEAYNVNGHNDFELKTVSFNKYDKRLTWALTNPTYQTPEGITYTIKVNNTTYNAGSANYYDFDNLPSGVYTFTVTATCKHGNTSIKSTTGEIVGTHVDFAIMGVGYDTNSKLMTWDVAYANADHSDEHITYTIATPSTTYTVVDDTSVVLDKDSGGFQVIFTARCGHGNEISKQFNLGGSGGFIFVGFGSNESTGGGATGQPDTHTDFNININPYTAGDNTLTWTIS